MTTNDKHNAAGIDQAKRYLLEGKPAQALEALDRVSWVDLHWSEYWMLRTQAFLQMEDYRRALKAVKSGLEENPANTDLWMLYVEVLLERGDVETASTVLAQSLDHLPDSFELQAYALTLEERMALVGHSAPKAPPLDLLDDDDLHVVSDATPEAARRGE